MASKLSENTRVAKLALVQTRMAVTKPKENTEPSFTWLPTYPYASVEWASDFDPLSFSIVGSPGGPGQSLYYI